jgi:uncharacterized membrane protein
MTVGSSIVLIAIGAILRFATTITWHASTVNWRLIGDILMILGLVGLIVGVALMSPATRRQTVSRPPDDGQLS